MSIYGTIFTWITLQNYILVRKKISKYSEYYEINYVSQLINNIKGCKQIDEYGNLWNIDKRLNDITIQNDSMIDKQLIFSHRII